MQINRLFEMVYLLLNKKSMTAGELARHFEVSPRTIYRDVELLSSAGIPIYMTKGKGGGISLLPDFVLNKAVLTDGEKSDILAALHAVEAVNLEQTNTAVEESPIPIALIMEVDTAKAGQVARTCTNKGFSVNNPFFILSRNNFILVASLQHDFVKVAYSLIDCCDCSL